MLSRIETITPEIANEMLGRNDENRGLREKLVMRYAEDMKNGRWKLTHQGIAFNGDGTLMDGQHRLAAIIESGTTQRMMVTRDIDKEAQIAMDDHARRTAGDALTLARGEPVSSTMVAIVRGCIELTSKGSPSKQELNDLLDTFTNPLVFIDPHISFKQRGVTSAPVWSAVALAWFYVDDLDRLSEFCRMLVGTDMVHKDGDRAALVLREWLLRNGTRGGGLRFEAFRKTQRAIVAFMEHAKITKLYGTEVWYPWPLIDPVR